MLWLVKKNQGERKMSVFRGFKYLVLIGLIFLASWALAEETGKIAGKVADAKTGERCPFTLVTIIGTKIGVNADENGNFVIDNLPEGSYDVKAKMIGYKDSEKDNVLVIQGKTTVQDFALDRSTIWPPLPPPGPGKSETVVIPIGSIKGKVTDSNKSEGLHNALVEIVGKKIIKLADVGGNYYFNVRPGTYVICAEKTGFKRSEMVEVDVVKNKTTVQNFKLEPETKP